MHHQAPTCTSSPCVYSCAARLKSPDMAAALPASRSSVAFSSASSTFGMNKSKRDSSWPELRRGCRRRVEWRAASHTHLHPARVPPSLAPAPRRPPAACLPRAGGWTCGAGSAAACRPAGRCPHWARCRTGLQAGGSGAGRVDSQGQGEGVRSRLARKVDRLMPDTSRCGRSPRQPQGIASISGRARSWVNFSTCTNGCAQSVGGGAVSASRASGF